MNSTSTLPTPAPLSELQVPALYQALLEQVRLLCQEQIAAAPATPIHIVGIWSGGAWLAEKLHLDLKLAGQSGIISSSLHRDDFSSKGMSASPKTSNLPFEVDGSHIILVDDVLQTGRTIRAVLNELYDFGRPARVSLAVLVDRINGRELPIAATCAGTSVTLPNSQRLRVDMQDASTPQLILQN